MFVKKIREQNRVKTKEGYPLDSYMAALGVQEIIALLEQAYKFDNALDAKDIATLSDSSSGSVRSRKPINILFTTSGTCVERYNQFCC